MAFTAARLAFFEKLRTLRFAVFLLRSAIPESATLFAILLLQGLQPGAALYALQLCLKAFETSTSIDKKSLGIAAGLWLFSLLAGSGSSVVSTIVHQSLSQKLNFVISRKIMIKCSQFIGNSFFEKVESQTLISLLTKDVRLKTSFFVNSLMLVVKDSVVVLSMTLGLWMVSPLLTVIVILGLLPLAKTASRIFRSIWDFEVTSAIHAQKKDWIFHTFTEKSILQETKTFQNRSFFMRLFAVEQQKMTGLLKKGAKDTFSNSLAFIGLLFLLCVLSFSAIGYLSASGKLTAASIVIILQSTNLLQVNSALFLENISFLFSNLGYFESLRIFLSQKEEMKNGKVVFPKSNAPLIEFKNVSLAFPDGRWALRNVSFRIRPGEKIALVGENGSGKSTLIKILLRFYDPTAGLVRINGIDLRQLNIHSWRKEVTAIFQDFGKYFVSLEQNIAFDKIRKNKSTSEALESATLNAGLSGILQSLTQGFETPLGNQFSGSELSGGQWQRVALARAFMKPASLLVMDEPTASLGPEADAELAKSWVSLAEGKTTVLVTHRMTSARKMDRIIVLDKGKVVEEGSHAELLAHKGWYANAYRTQAESFSDCT
jgi:ATP-binding cassette subfamily B protein